MYDEFFGIEESEQYAFYRVPKLLFTTDRFWNLSTDAKMLYGLLLDRMALSQKNGWVDEQGRVYIIYTIENIMEAIGCGNKKAIGLLAELENKANLILRKKQGLGKPNLIYVKKFTVVANTPVERHFLKCQNDTSGNGQSTSLGVSKEHSNNTDINNTEFSNTDPFFSSDFCGKEVDGTADFQRYHQYFYEQLYMEYLKKDFPYSVIFSAGTAVTFVTLGIIATSAGKLMGTSSPVWYMILGVLMVLMALQTWEIFNFIPSVNLISMNKKKGIVGAFLMGILGGIFSSPCSTPVLIALLAIVAGEGNLIWGILLMLLYSIGHSALVMVAGTSIGFVQKINSSKRYNSAAFVLKIVMGTAILLIGLYMFWLAF